MEWEKFNFLYTTIENGNNHFSYILDSNVVVGLSNFYYQKIKDVDNSSRYEKLYKYLLDKDVIPGIAIRELSWDVEKNKVDPNEEKVIAEAMDGLFSNFSRGEKIFKPSRHMSFNSIVDNKEANDLLIMSFCLLKKLAILYKTEKSQKMIYEKLIDFILNEHKMLLSYEMILITYWLFGNKKELKDLLQKLLKINSKDIGDWQIYNASWDLFFLRVINSLTARSKDKDTVDNIYNVCLVTEDKALSELGKLVLNQNEITSINRSGMTMPCTSIQLDYIKEEYKELVCEKMDYLYNTFSTREPFIKNNSNIIDYYFKLIDKLNN